jgi:peptidoglycan/LPS O-acetylase OafA/YrhL
MSSAPTTTLAHPERLESVDALRGIAFLCVLLVHSAQAVPAFSGQSEACAGAYGVSLFFIASAFTLFASQQQCIGRDRAPVTAFFIRRVFRVVPLFWAGIIFYFLIYGTWNRNWAEGSLGWFHFGLTAAILHGWHPDTINSVVPGGWSIAAEFGFYAIAPFLFGAITNLRRALVGYALVLFLALILSNLARAGMVARAFPEVPAWRQASFTYLWLPAHLPTFLLGIVVFYLRPHFQKQSVDRRRSTLLANIAVLLIAARWLRGDIADYVFPVLLAFFVLSILTTPWRAVVNRFTCSVGTLSFSAYITHFAAVKVAEKLLARLPNLSSEIIFLLIYGSALTLTILVSWITYRVIEQPGIELGRRLIRTHLAAPRPTASASIV